MDLPLKALRKRVVGHPYPLLIARVAGMRLYEVVSGDWRHSSAASAALLVGEGAYP
jgi:hypothetical protein